MNCPGDVQLGRPPFEEIELNIKDSKFSGHGTSDICAHIGIPILTRRCPPDPRWANYNLLEGPSPRVNQKATFLHLCLDPNATADPSGTGSQGWGRCHMDWAEPAGSLIAIRKDKKPILPLHIEALATWCKEEIEPLLEHSNGVYAPDEPASKEQYLQIISRPLFYVYWHKFCREKNAFPYPSPYYEM